MKFVQLVDDNKGDIFLQKSSRIWDSKTNSRPLFAFAFFKALYIR